MKSKGLSGVDSDICGCAIGVLQSVIDSLHDGSVKIGFLKMLKSKQEEFQNVLTALYQPSSEGTVLAQARSVFTLRLNEYNYFSQYKQNLQHLCHHLSGLDVKGSILYMYEYACTMYGTVHV